MNLVRITMNTLKGNNHTRNSSYYSHLIMGCDPGIRGTGIVVMTEDKELLFAATLSHAKKGDWQRRTQTIAHYFHDVLEEVSTHCDELTIVMEDAFHFKGTRGTIINVKLVGALATVAQCYTDNFVIITPRKWKIGNADITTNNS